MKGAAAEVGLRRRAPASVRYLVIVKAFSCAVRQTGRRNTGVYYHNKQAPIKEIINGIVPDIKHPIMPQKPAGWGDEF